MSNKFNLLEDSEPAETRPRPVPKAAPVGAAAKSSSAPRPARSAANATTGAAPAPKQTPNVGGAAASTKPRGPRGSSANTGHRAPKHSGFDRQSGNGRGREVRKGGAGKFGWGNAKEPQVNGEAGAEKKEKTPEAEATAAPEGEAAATDATTSSAAAATEEKKEPEAPPIFTLQDFERQRQSALVADDIKAPRKVIDGSGFKAGKTLNTGKTSTGAKKAGGNAKKEKKVLSLDEFNDNAGSAAGGNDRQFRRNQPRRFDANDFPALK